MEKKYLGEDLIFLISQPRSGSTLLQRILSGHPDIQTSAETWLMLHPTYGLHPEGLTAEYDAKNAAIGTKEFLTHYTDGLGTYDDAIRQWARTIYGNALSKGEKAYFLDKTPRYFFIIPDLYRLFPKARYIFLIRNPLAVLSSLVSTYVKENWPTIGFFKPDLLMAPDLILKGIDMLGEDAIVIRYEDFVSDPERNISMLCKRLKIEFLPDMLDYAHTEQPKGRLNDPVGIHQHTKPSINSLDKWRTMVEREQTCYFAACYLDALGTDVIKNLGYSPDELGKIFPGTLVKNRNKKLFPFNIAMKLRREWTFREWFVAERFFEIEKKGYLKGTLSITRRGYRRAKKLLKEQITKV